LQGGKYILFILNIGSICDYHWLVEHGTVGVNASSP
jgi:hypothetical protein